jgi:hypothetical protein
VPELKKIIEGLERDLNLRDVRIKVLEKYILDNGLMLPDEGYIQANKDIVLQKDVNEDINDLEDPEG